MKQEIEKEIEKTKKEIEGIKNRLYEQGLGEVEAYLKGLEFGLKEQQKTAQKELGWLRGISKLGLHISTDKPELWSYIEKRIKKLKNGGVK